LPCVELLLGVAALAAPAAGDGAVEPPALHESGLESGLRVLVATPQGAAAPSAVAAEFVLAVGWANDETGPGRDLALRMAEFVTKAPEGEAHWQADVRPSTTHFRGEFQVDGLEAELATLSKWLTADGVDEARFNEVMQAHRAPAADAFDRFREAAWPTSRLGGRAGQGGQGGSSSGAAPTRDAFKEFLAQRCGCEGALLVLVGGRPAALELMAGRAFSGLPRARGVAPAESLEPFPSRPRLVAAPPGVQQRLIGFRLAWQEDPHGDARAFARAWLEELAGRPAARFEETPQGALLAFAASDMASEQSLRDALVAGAEQLATGRPLSDAGFRLALDRLDLRLAEATATPAALARLLAEEATATQEPLAPFERRRRLEREGAEAAARRLRTALLPAGRIEVAPPPAPEPRATEGT